MSSTATVNPIISEVLRTSRGIGLARFRQRFGVDLVQDHSGILRNYPDNGLITVENAFIHSTCAGMFAADALAHLDCSM